jgi:tetratricopeptide (TPR) repeat protein
VRRGPLALSLLVLAAPSRAEVTSSVLLQEAVTAYREGRLEAALLKMGEVVDREPENATAKNYVWAIVRRIQKDERRYRVSPRDVARAVAVAEEELAARRLRTEEALGRMREAARLSGNVRSPGDVLAGAAGLERFIGKELEGELADAQARDFSNQVVAHLEEALKRKIFVSLKDQYRAEGYLAYIRQEWDQAAALWEKAVKEDPADDKARKDLESLRELVAGRERKEKVAELSNQARLYFRSGRYQESLESWRAVARLEPEFPGLTAQAAAARTALEKSRLQGRLKGMTEEGLALYRAGDAFAAAQKWLEVLQLDPSHEEARGWLQHAGKRLRQSPAPAPAPRPAASPAGQAAAGHAAAPAATPRGNPDKALSLYKEGMILYAQGSLPEAVKAWEESLRLDPSLSRAREALRQANAELTFK